MQFEELLPYLSISIGVIGVIVAIYGINQHKKAKEISLEKARELIKKEHEILKSIVVQADMKLVEDIFSDIDLLKVGSIIIYQTNDCWEQWTVYCAEISGGYLEIDVNFYANTT